MTVASAEIMRALEDVYDPELGLSVIALGLVYGVDVADGVVRITMTLTTADCPIHGAMLEWVRRAVMALPGVADVQVTVTFDPPWTPERMRLEPIP